VPRAQFLIGDGQVTLGQQVIKPNARKVRQGVACGFAGATADAMTLFERLEMKLSEHPETMRACVEMAKAWRLDQYLRRLEAVMIVVDKDVSRRRDRAGQRAARRGRVRRGDDWAQGDVDIAADMCVYTNKNYVTELLSTSPEKKPEAEE